jgi:hypothetical protein
MSGGAGTAGLVRGHLNLDFNVNEGTDERITYLPTESAFLKDGGAARKLVTQAGGVKSPGRTAAPFSVVLLEATVFAWGITRSTGTPLTNGYGLWVLRAHGICDSGGNYSLPGSVTTVLSAETMVSGTAPVVTIVADANGFHIQVTPGANLAGEIDQVYWGILKVSAFTMPDYTWDYTQP